MHRLGLRALLSIQLLVVSACPKEQVDPGGSAGLTTGTSAATAQPTGVDPPTEASSTSTGSSGVPTEASSTSTSTGASSGELTSGSSGTNSSSSTSDSGIGGTGEVTTGPAPVLVDCFDCLCDINISFCRKVFAGAQALQQGPDRECPIVAAEGLESGCVLYPARCGDTPTCECLPTMNGGCFCNQISPGNFQVTCPLP